MFLKFKKKNSQEQLMTMVYMCNPCFQYLIPATAYSIRLATYLDDF